MIARTFLAAASGITAARAASGSSLMPWPDAVRRGFPFAVGALTASATALAVPGSPTRSRSGAQFRIGLAGVGAAVGVGVLAYRARKRFLGALFREGRDVETVLATAPTDAMVSGSVESVVPINGLGREGARFVHSVTNAADVLDVLGQSAIAQPIRIFVGHHAASTIEERVQLALAELDRTDAWSRGSILVLAPAGTGYANSTPVDALEILTRGDCATVVIGYGLLPSFLSMDRTEPGAASQRTIIQAILDRGYSGRLLLYGESLGARVQQRAVDPHLLSCVDRALWVGTPGGAQQMSETTVRVEHPDMLSDADAKVWLLEHDADPVVRLRHDVLWRRPAWLARNGSRGREIPSDMRWRPGITYAQVIIDTLFATDIRPGDFHSRGHDYRADLAAVASAAFGFGLDWPRTARLDARLRALEIARAARIDGGFAPTP